MFTLTDPAAPGSILGSGVLYSERISLVAELIDLALLGARLDIPKLNG